MTRDLIERLADAATREIHGDDYRLDTRLVIERAIKAFIRSALEAGKMLEEPKRYQFDHEDTTFWYVRATDYVALRAKLLAVDEENAQLRRLIDRGTPISEYERRQSERAGDAEERGARLEAALLAARDALYNGFEPDNQSRAWHAADKALSPAGSERKGGEG